MQNDEGAGGRGSGFGGRGADAMHLYGDDFRQKGAAAMPESGARVTKGEGLRRVVLLWPRSVALRVVSSCEREQQGRRKTCPKPLQTLIKANVYRGLVKKREKGVCRILSPLRLPFRHLGKVL
jgi:hypothetical protein